MTDSNTVDRTTGRDRSRISSGRQHTGRAASMVTVIGLALLATSGCAAAASQEDAQPSASTASATPPAASAAAATTEGTFEFADGTTVGLLAEPWTEVDGVAGMLLHMLPGAPGTDIDGSVWGDIIVYVPDAAYGPGATTPQKVPEDPVQWTASHTDLEILDQRRVTVDGVTATQIDARAVRPTNWLAVETEPFEWSGAERVVLIPLDDSWLVVRGSAWQEDVAFADPATPGDAFTAVLESVDLAP